MIFTEYIPSMDSTEVPSTSPNCTPLPFPINITSLVTTSPPILGPKKTLRSYLPSKSYSHISSSLTSFYPWYTPFSKVVPPHYPYYHHRHGYFQHHSSPAAYKILHFETPHNVQLHQQIFSVFSLEISIHPTPSPQITSYNSSGCTSANVSRTDLSPFLLKTFYTYYASSLILINSHYLFYPDYITTIIHIPIIYILPPISNHVPYILKLIARRNTSLLKNLPQSFT